MSFQSTVSKLLVNRTVLHVVFVISLLNLIAYLVSRNFQAVIFFILIGSIVGNFSKNMTVVLLVPLFLANLFVYIQHRRARREGYDNLDDNSKEKKVDDEDKKDDSQDKKDDSQDKKPIKIATKQGLPTTPIDEKDSKKADKDKDKDKDKDRDKMEESFQSAGSRKGQYDIDYAATIEDAYNELNNLIGGDGIQKLTADTQQLMNQQLQLTKAMQGFAPMIDQIKPLMESVGPMMKQAKELMGPRQQ